MTHVADDTAPAKSGAETRQRILAAAIELFVIKGFAGTSVRDIAERTELTKAALYYHFSSKEQILDAVAEPLISEFGDLKERATAVPTPSPAELLAGITDILSRRIGLLRTVMADPSVNRKPDHQKMEDFMNVLAGALADDGTSEQLLRARCALGALQGGIFSTATLASQFHQPPSPDQIRRFIEGKEHVVTEEQRHQIVEAALRALG